jgi:hypothetical protein
MKNKREKKKISSSGKALLVFLCFVLTVFFIALKGFSHSSEEDSHFKSMKWDSQAPSINNPGVTGGLVIDDHLQSPNERSKMSSGGPLTEVGAWGYGQCWGSFAQNNLLYMGTGRMMEIYDISNPESPVRLGSIVLKDLVQSIDVDGNYAYIGLARVGFQVVDISNPSFPVPATIFETGSWVYDMYIDGFYAYVADGYKFRIVDISNPTNPVEIAMHEMNVTIRDVHVIGNYAYLAGSYRELTIMDVSNPQSPIEVGYYDNNWSSSGLYVSGSHAYIAASIGGLRIIDVSTPGNPVEVGFFKYGPYDGYNFLDVYIVGNYAYVAYESGLLVINVSNPGSPYLVDTIDIEGYPNEVSVFGNHAFVSSKNEGLHIIDISSVSNLSESSYIDAADYTLDVCVSGSYAYLANNVDGLRIIDISNPNNPIEVGNMPTQYYLRGLDVVGSYAYLAGSGIHIVDISDPSTPVEIGSCSTQAWTWKVNVSGNYAYASGCSSGLSIVDVANPTSPTEVGYCTWDNEASCHVQVDGSYAYVADNLYGLRVIDISNPAAPQLVSGLFTGGHSSSVFVYGKYVYLGDGSDGLKIIDIQNPLIPVEVGSYYDSNFGVSDLHVIGDYVFVSNFNIGISIINASNPSSLFVEDSLELPVYREGIFVSNDYAYVANGSCGHSIIDVSDYTPFIRIDSPNGGEYWGFGTDQLITWTSFGISGNVKIEYTPDDRDTWIEITDSTENDGSFLWTVPQNISDYYRVRVSDISASISDISDAVFTVGEQKVITVTAPNGSENWEGGTSQDITWNYTGDIDNVKIEFSTNNGTSWIVEVESTPNTGTYNWTVPNTPSTSCLVKISDTAGPASDTSEAVFTIAARRTLTVTAPNGSENWEGTTSQNITWSSTGSIANVKLEYSTNNGSSWNTITASTANSGAYNWTVPNTPSTSCLVKVTDTVGPTSDTSDAVFTIEALRTLAVTSPNGGENWEGTTSHNITWSSTGSIANVKLEYSTNNGSSWNTITASTANSGTYNWTVPNTPSTSCLVKISDTAGPAADTSDGIFTIAAQRTLTLTSPNGGENWEAGTSQNITWTSTGSIANVKLEYSTNNGSSWNTITASSANSGSYNWTVPNTPSTTCLVKVSDTAGPAADTSDGVFTISAERTITVTAPNGGETWEGTTSQNITWSSTGSIANVKLEYSTNNGSSWNTITASTTNSGTYNWTVPNTPSTNCLVKISDTAGPAADTSDAVFTIASQRTLTVIAPNGGQRWFINSTYAITWSSTGSISTVMIEYSTNIGGSWTTITSSTSNTGTYNWTIPNTPSTNCLVRVSDTTGPAADTSNSVFTIDPYPTITVSAPNGGETWIANTTHSITWTYTGTIAAVNLEYSSNNGTSWTSIAGSVSNSGSYNWLIPYISSTNCLVRVSDTATTASDTSNAVFTIELPPSLTVTAPNGGESWRRKSTQTITWTWTGTVGDVKIQYTMDGGSSWTVITSSTANNGSYQWTLPNVSSSKTQCLVKIEAINGSAEDTSDAFFTIKK